MLVQIYYHTDTKKYCKLDIELLRVCGMLYSFVSIHPSLFHLSNYLSIYLSIYLSSTLHKLHSSIYPFFSQFIYASNFTHLSIHPCINSSTYTSIYLFIYPSIHLSILPFIHPSISSVLTVLGIGKLQSHSR